jgi:hypothetical protein
MHAWRVGQQVPHRMHERAGGRQPAGRPDGSQRSERNLSDVAAAATAAIHVH